MEKRLGQIVKYGLFLLALTVMAVLPPLKASSAPYAAMVMDARTGEVLHSRNADTRLHPASLTKMMTLYIAFEAVKNGEISLDTDVRISRKAANEPPSKLGLRAGSKIKFRYLIRAAAVKSANDAATAIAEAISGSEAAFASRMNRTAKALGMTKTTFKNAHGLTEAGHLSTARDMTILGRSLYFHHPEYYNLFSRTSTYAGLRDVANTNRRFLGAYRGADGIKTGYTRAAGFNLVASAARGNERIITTVFGGVSSAARNAKVSELMNLGFRRAPSKARINKPERPNYAVAKAGGGGKSVRVSGLIKKSPLPLARPGAGLPALPENVLVAMAADIQQALADVQGQATPAPVNKIDTQAAVVAALAATPQNQVAPALSLIPAARPGSADEPAVELASYDVEPDDPGPEIVTRISTSGGRFWGINIGAYNTKFEAERVLLKTALREIETLDEALRKVVAGRTGYEANFVGLSQETAALACRRLQARQVPCTTLGP